MKFNDNFTADFSKGSSNSPGYYKSGTNFRFYNGDSFTIKPAVEEILITKITINHESLGGYNSSTYVENGETKTATESQQAKSGTTLTIDFGTQVSECTLIATGTNKIKDITIEYVAGASSSKTASEIAFEQTEYTATLNQDFVSPTATITAGDGVVTYSSSNTNVATVNETTGVVTLVAEGTAIITATISETETYAKASATYTLTVVDGREAATISFAETSFTANLGETFTAPVPTVTPDDAVVAYESSNTDVATVDASTGAVTLVAAGTTTITASIAETATHKAASATYTLKVVDPNAPAAEKFVLVTDASTLVNGQKIIIVSKNNNAALGPQSGNNCPQVAITKKDNGTTIEPNDNVQIITLETTTTTDSTNCFAFNVGGKYLYAASSSSNYLKTQTTLNDNGKATIEINSTNVATITFKGSNTNKVLRYNNSAKVFSCYASGQQDVQIYALPAQSTDPVDPVDPVDPEAPAAPVISESWNKVTITAEEGTTIYYTTHESWDETEHADPTTESTEYSKPIEFYGPFSIKAIAVKDGKTSAVASYDVNTYVYEDLGSLSDISSAWSAYKFVFNCQLTVVYQDTAKKNLYVNNGYNNMLIYGGDQAAYAPGDVINGVCATYKDYNNLIEFVPTAFGEVNAAAGTVRQPAEINYSNVAENYMHQYVMLPEVTIKSIQGKDNKNITVTDAKGHEVIVYNQFDITTPTVGTKCDVTGFVGVYKADYQIYPTEFTSYTGEISLGEAYSYNEYSKANVLTFTATISKNGTPIDNEEKANYEVYLDETNICNASETYSHFAYNKDAKFSLKNGDRTIALDVEWPNLDAVLPTITEAKYITYSDNADRTDAKYYIEASDDSYNWTFKSTDEKAIVGWENNRAFCLYENATPDAINVKITFPFAVTKAIAPLAADEEYDIVTYEPANATELSTAEFAKDESNTEVSGVADVAVDQNTNVEYYNLQGVRVNGDLTPGLYIRRQGNQATKVVVR